MPAIKPVRASGVTCQTPTAAKSPTTPNAALRRARGRLDTSIDEISVSGIDAYRAVSFFEPETSTRL